MRVGFLNRAYVLNPANELEIKLPIAIAHTYLKASMEHNESYILHPKPCTINTNSKIPKKLKSNTKYPRPQTLNNKPLNPEP